MPVNPNSFASRPNASQLKSYKGPVNQAPTPRLDEPTISNRYTLEPESRTKIDGYRSRPLPNPDKNITIPPQRPIRTQPEPRPITNMPVDPRGMEQRKMREQEMLMRQIAQRRALENARMGRNF